ncbi:MAG: type II toxin-antitoxin system prevent-host-death family antitoxin [Candidatus Competibacteraceae bacterium]|nr:type II toxin-antitoxin system prevent-host-death family antitoxin [Candidatus Competibacteraceae bacterium]
MERQISLREANQHLSRYIEAVQEGHEIIITRRGEPVARLVGVTYPKVLNANQQAARKRSLERMLRGYSLEGQPIRRDELYER